MAQSTEFLQYGATTLDTFDVITPALFAVHYRYKIY